MIADETQPLPNSKAQRGKWRKWVVAGGGLLLKSGRFRVDQVVEITHPGYEPLQVTLASLLGGDRFPLSKKELAVKVWPLPKTSPH